MKEPASVTSDAGRRALLTRYRQVIEDGRNNTPEIIRAYNALRLADALDRKRRLNQAQPDHPPQLALLGPTQAGKSTLVNIVLDSDKAGVSALAGYTVHAIGLAVGCGADALEAVEASLAPARRVALDKLDARALDTFVLEPIKTGDDALLERAVVWDSPDFDSIEAAGYRGAVLSAAAVSDVLIFVLSKDKYGDRSVWDMLALLRRLGRPLLICLNKVDAHDEDVIARAFSTRYRERFETEPPPLITLPFVRSAAHGRLASSDVIATLGDALAASVAAIDREVQAQAVENWIAREHAGWLAPLGGEIIARDDWDASVTAMLDEAEQQYVERYLHDPRKYDTFNRALAELLTLLELPGIARSLARTREIVTWPARTLLGVGRRQLPSAVVKAPDQEAEALKQIVEQVVSRLSITASDQRDAADDQHVDEQARWWRALQRTLRDEGDDISTEFEARSESVRAEFEPRIEAAAERLHERLRTQPALLGTLRAARVTADAAGVALAVKSGGLAPADLVLAPAMLSVTTLLTESALGRYLDTIRRELQDEQRAIVRRELIDGVLGVRLRQLSRTLEDDSLLSTGLDDAVIDAARHAAPS